MNLEIIMGVPANYWFIMVASHIVHIYLKIEGAKSTNKVAAKKYWNDKFKLSGVLMSFAQSIVLLIASHDAYVKYVQINESDLAPYFSFAVAFIGYGGSSMWNNIMDLVKSKFNV